MTYLPKYWDTLTPYHTCFSISSSIWLPVDVSDIAGCMTNSEDPDQTPLSVASEFGLHYLPRPVCQLEFLEWIRLGSSNEHSQHTFIYRFYGIKKNHFRILEHFKSLPCLFLTLGLWVNFQQTTVWNFFLTFLRKQDLAFRANCLQETICLKCQILFSGKNKKNINLSSAELAQRVVTVKFQQVHLSCWTRICPVFANSVDPDRLASEEANWSRSALFVVKYVN